MALGLDPRFDLTHAYFLVAGIGGIDPQMGSLASAVWSDYIVDGDLAHEIDAREIPKDWKTGYVPLGKSTPYEQPRTARFGDDGNVYHLNTALVDWAFNLTKDTELPDTPQMKERRMRVRRTPPPTARPSSSAATTSPPPPSGTASSSTNGPATGSSTRPTATAPTPSAAWRTPAPCSPSPGSPAPTSSTSTASSSSAPPRNFDQQRIGVTAAESLSETKVRQYSAYLPALDSAYRVGHIVVDNLVANWPQTRDHIP